MPYSPVEKPATILVGSAAAAVLAEGPAAEVSTKAMLRIWCGNATSTSGFQVVPSTHDSKINLRLQARANVVRMVGTPPSTPTPWRISV